MTRSLLLLIAITENPAIGKEARLRLMTEFIIALYTTASAEAVDTFSTMALDRIARGLR